MYVLIQVRSWKRVSTTLPPATEDPIRGTHLVADKQLQGRPEVEFGLSERPGDRGDRRRDDALDAGTRDEVLHVGREAERHALVGADERLPRSEACGGQPWPWTALESHYELTRQDLSHVHHARLAAEVEPVRGPVVEAAHIGEEADRSRLERELLAHEPQALRRVHRSDHVLRRVVSDGDDVGGSRGLGQLTFDRMFSGTIFV